MLLKMEMKIVFIAKCLITVDTEKTEISLVHGELHTQISKSAKITSHYFSNFAASDWMYIKFFIMAYTTRNCLRLITCGRRSFFTLVWTPLSYQFFVLRHFNFTRFVVSVKKNCIYLKSFILINILETN